MMCMLTSAPFGTSSEFQEADQRSVESPQSEEDNVIREDSSTLMPVVEESGEIVDVQLPPTPPVAHGDCEEFVPMPKKETCDESPLKGYRRVLAKNGDRWALQFVSPEGLRFDSQDELALHVCKERGDLSLGEWKKLDLHFLKISSPPPPPPLPSQEDHRQVPLTFCSMRQNIFDMKRKRGVKRAHHKDLRRNSVAVIECQGLEVKKIAFMRRFTSEESVQPPPPVEEEEESHEVFVDISSGTEDEPEDSAEEDPLADEEDTSMLCEVPLNEDEELVMGCGIIRRFDDCTVDLMDLFQGSPLSSFECTGCRDRYCGKKDSFTVDLKCQIIRIVCHRCRWWTSRSVDAKYKEVPS